jgi:hypothetical protein
VNQVETEREGEGWMMEEREKREEGDMRGEEQEEREKSE